MAANFDDDVQISVVADAAPIGRAGFGTLLVVDAAPMSERIRYYTTAAAALADVGGSGITAAQAAAIAAGFAQQPRPARIAAGRAAAEVAQVTTITVGGTPASGDYSFEVGGELVAATATVPSDTNNDIAADLRADAATALSALGISVSGTGAEIILTGVAGVAFEVDEIEAPSGATLTPVTGTPAVSLASELDAIVAANPDWYGLTLVSRTKLTILHAAAWAETANRIFLAQSSDADILTTANTDVAYELEQLGYNRTALLYHPTNGQYADAAWMAKKLAADLDVQTTAWAHTTLVGITPAAISETQKANALAKNTNLYLTMGGAGATGEGKMASGRYIDIQTTIDWLVNRIRERVIQLLLNESNANRKIPYTDEGFAQIESAVRSVLSQALRARHLAKSGDGTPPYIHMPRRSSISAEDAAQRILRFSFGGLLAGAVQKVIGSGSVTTDNNAFELLAEPVEV